MSDRVQINNLERALSSDINALQSMQTRMLGTLMKYLVADRLVTQTGAPNDTVPRSGTLGLDITPSGGGTTIDVNPGMLAQLSATHPAVPAALESDLRLGWLREALTVAHPGGASTVYLVEARVVDVVTVSTTRDIFDVPTQTFVPTVVDKQVERQIEVQFVAGAGFVVPAFTGDPWVPLRTIETDAGGLWNGAAQVFDMDLRPDIRDSVNDEGPLFSGGDPGHPDPVIYDHSLSTSFFDGTGSAGVVGHLRGRVGQHRVGVQAAGTALQPFLESGYVRAADTLEHLYLVPLIANGIEVTPVGRLTAISPGIMKGVLVASDTAPEFGSRQASANLTLGGNLANFDPVPAHLAVHIASVYAAGVGTYHWFSQDAGGRCMHRVGATPMQILNDSRSVGSGFNVALDMRGVIPPNARWALLWVRTVSDASITNHSFEMRNNAVGAGGSLDRIPPGLIVVPSVATGVNEYSALIWLPVGMDPTGNLDQFWELEQNIVGGPGNVDTDAFVVGWSF